MDRPTAVADVSRAFAIFDMDGSGKIDSRELQRVMMNVGEPVSWSDVQQVVTELDRNGDGAIDLQEFSAALLVDSGQAGVREAKKQLKGERKLRGPRLFGMRSKVKPSAVAQAV